MTYKLRFFADFCLALTASQTLIKGSLEESIVSAGDMAQGIAVSDATRPWLVLDYASQEKVGTQLVGYAYAARWKACSAHRFAREVRAFIYCLRHRIRA